ncbi:MAG: right-handed parallel beta-helix repeat-containing protein [Candidatus Bathyarchaeia archaeon]
MGTRSASVLIFLTLVLCLFTTQSSYLKAHASNSFPVHNLNTGLNYTTIAEAIAANETLSGDTIFVEKGVYNESIWVEKQLHLVGEDRETTIIDGNMANEVIWLLPGASVTNFTVRHGFYGIRAYSFGLLPQYGGTSIINNKVEDALYAGIVLGKVYNNTIMDNIITNNILSGIHIWSSTNNTITNNTVFNNGHGIDFYGYCRDNVLRNNTISDNTYNFGLIWYGDTLNWLLGMNGPNIINDVDASNTVNGKPICCWVNRSNERVPLDAGFVWLTDCDNITVKNLNLSNNIEGMMLAGTTNTLIDCNNITGNAYGIHVSLFSYNNVFVNNTLRDNGNGVYLGEYATNTTMRNNAISGGQYNFGVPSYEWGYIRWVYLGFTNATSGLDDIDLSNTVDGKPIVWWINQHNMKVPSNAGYVMLINCTDITAEGLSLSNNIQNIILLNSNNTLISNNSISNSVHGISIEDLPFQTSNGWYFQPSVNNTIMGNTLLDNGIGCRLEEGDYTILNNTLYRNPLGIGLLNANDSIIAGNTVIGSELNITYPPPDVIIFFHPLQHWQLDSDLNYGNVGGIMFDGKSNMIYDNTVEDSREGIIAGYRTYFAQGNIVCHNNLINNTYQAWEPMPPSDSWDFGYPTGGNYWSDYTGTDVYSGPYQNETGSDGIGDTAFLRSRLRIFDHYPLMNPYTDLYDIAIADSMTAREFLRQHREIINISINVINLSVEAETINITFQANSTMIATFQNISLAIGKSTNITYEWNVTGLPYGEYLINASATPVPNETRIFDNRRSLLTVHTVPGDLNQDGTVSSDDAKILADQFGSAQNQPTWISSADINGDGEVDIFDAIILANNFGRTW